jgi:hypothetical protein
MNSKRFFPLLLTLFVVSACRVVRGSGDVETESRSVNGFDQVSLNGQGKLILKQGEQEALEIEAEDNIIAVIETEVRANTLHIGTKANTTIRPTEPVRFYLTMIEIASLEISGSGNMVADNVTTDRLTLQINGSGDISIDSLSAASLIVDINGAGDVEVAGRATGQAIEISGSGNYRAADLESEAVDVGVNGAGETTVWASQTLDVEISGSGNVNYYGSPAASQDINGSGEVNSLGTR